VTETEWLACADPRPMLRSLVSHWKVRQRAPREATSFERLRLFACACCRRVWDLLDDDHRTVLTMIEQYARAPTTDGLRAARRARRAAGNRLSNEMSLVSRQSPPDPAAVSHSWGRLLCGSAVWEASQAKPTTAANAHLSVARAVHAIERVQKLREDPAARAGWIGRSRWEAESEAELAAQADLLRDVVGNPFRPVAVDPAWLGWNGGIVPRLARAVYDNQPPDTGFLDKSRLLILADALEEAGCRERYLLGHCRGDAPHARGCFLVDALLGLP
jgi:hypothetical protein